MVSMIRLQRISFISVFLAALVMGLFIFHSRGGPAKAPIQATEGQTNEAPFVCFTPEKDCTSRIVQELSQAQKSIQMQAFSFTSSPIAKALVAAQKRGVKVEAILDKTNFLNEFTQTEPLLRAGIPIDLDGEHQTAHNKVILVDGTTDRKSTRLNSSHIQKSRMPSSA